MALATLERERWAAAVRLAAWLGIAGLSLWLRTGFPVHAIGSAEADDALFIRLARSLLAGEWLGPYDNLTLAKGIFYPLFIATSSFLSIPLRVAEQACYLGASALAAVLVSRCTGRRWLGLVIFAVLAFNPALWSLSLARVIRENLYISLSLALVLLTVLAAFPPPASKLWHRAVLGVCLGLVAAGYWLTREEGVWLLPALAVVLLTALAGLLWPRWREAGPAGANRLVVRLSASALPLLLAGGVFAAGLSTVSWLNAAHYGVSGNNEFKSRAFERGYGALSRIRHDHWRRLVVFPRDARQRAYAASPAARELEPYFEGAGGEGWRRVGCTQSLMPSAVECPEILAGWFMWALRDAVTAAGHGRSAVAARDFYLRLASEIDEACDSGRLDCLPRRATLAPPFRVEYLRHAAGAAVTLLERLVTMREGPVGSAPSIGPRSAIQVFADAVGPVFPPDGPQRRLQGWVGATAGRPDISLRGPEGVTVSASVARWPGDYIRSTYPDMNGLAFALETSCPPSQCVIVVEVENGPRVSLPWDSARQGMILDTGTVRLYGDLLTSLDTDRMGSRRRSVQTSIAGVIGAGYANGFPVLGGLGLIGLLLALVRHRRRPVPACLIALMLGCGAAFSARLALLAYLDATSIPSANLLYLSPALPFVIIFSVLGTWLGFRALRTDRAETPG
ncbi:hypothetical protein VQH23_08055 [Pararoseomonas sp. SCSIO 73927]|uniref:hypothetical protein n=1 Tax=Pararoseomonas sp. SCSIO 73927 TaxID=3114537 RepID=UPI0030D55508